MYMPWNDGFEEEEEEEGVEVEEEEVEEEEEGVEEEEEDVTAVGVGGTTEEVGVMAGFNMVVFVTVGTVVVGGTADIEEAGGEATAQGAQPQIADPRAQHRHVLCLDLCHRRVQSRCRCQCQWHSHTQWQCPSRIQ